MQPDPDGEMTRDSPGMTEVTQPHPHLHAVSNQAIITVWTSMAALRYVLFRAYLTLHDVPQSCKSSLPLFKSI